MQKSSRFPEVTVNTQCVHVTDLHSGERQNEMHPLSLSPPTLFRWCGFDPLAIYPELWQCIRMIVGVSGVGYGIAARDPFRHWSIAFVGLLGKIFGQHQSHGAARQQVR